MSSGNEQFRARKQQQEREAEANLETAKSEAHASGKEPFDLDLLERLWPENPNARAAANGIDVPRTQRLKEWEHSYYLLYPGMRTNAEFIDRMKTLAAHGCFD
jgi:hypothetical protein